MGDMRLENTACNLCGQDDTELLFSRRDALTGDAAKFSVVGCKHCGLIYVNPRPSVQDIGRFYPPEFVSYQFDVTGSGHVPLRERMVSFMIKSSAKQRVDMVRKLIKPTGRLRALDIGCGKGSFLHTLNETLDCEVAGIDFDEDSARYCREQLDLNVIHGEVSILDKIGTEYDLVTMWHFLEHEYDPVSALKHINGCLGEGKLLVVEVPNAESLENRLFRKHSYLYDVPRHLYNFSPTTIARFLKSAGFEPLHITFPFFAGGWIGSVQELLFKGKVYRNLKDNIFLFLLLSQLLFPFDYLSGATKKGSIMRVVAKKVCDKV